MQNSKNIFIHNKFTTIKNKNSLNLFVTNEDGDFEHVKIVEENIKYKDVERVARGQSKSQHVHNTRVL